MASLSLVSKDDSLGLFFLGIISLFVTCIKSGCDLASNAALFRLMLRGVSELGGLKLLLLVGCGEEAIARFGWGLWSPWLNRIAEFWLVAKGIVVWQAALEVML